MTIAVYCEKPSPRLTYVCKLLFGQLMGADYQFFSDAEAFHQFDGFKINYSETDLAANLHWSPHSILSEGYCDEIIPEVAEWDGIPTLFPNKDPNWPFDLFAATFFLVTRYEEYGTYQADKHGRFPAEESIAHKHKFLERPLINEWVVKLQEQIKEAFPRVELPQKHFEAEATFDIDVAWAYLNKGFFRTTAALALDVVLLKIKRFSERLSVLLGSRKDPYDTYQYIEEQCVGHGIPLRYFFLLGDYSSYDRNSSHLLPAMRNLIAQLAAKRPVGIHPSYGSHASEKQLRTEISRLGEILDKSVDHSRQHYLKMTLPETYRRLVACGIRHDHTMGYAQQVGFRASVCSPFTFYDVQNDEELPLTIYPFAYMDGTLNQYMGLSPDEAVVVVKELIDRVYRVSGLFICLWHNSSLSDRGDWKGWRSVFESTLKDVQSRKHA